jgi:Formyl transferase
MKILCITACSRRHHALVRRLTELGPVDVIGEVPPERKIEGPAMAEYYRRMDEAEEAVFPHPTGLIYIKGATLELACNMGAASEWNGDLEPYDRIVTYGCSWLRPPLVDRLIAKEAINLHAGVAPEYRGTACNFWALYDGHPDLVGYTVHRLDAGLDNGGILRAARYFEPDHSTMDPWMRGMTAVERGFGALLDEVENPSSPVRQDRTMLIRYSRAADFTEAVCAEYLGRLG